MPLVKVNKNFQITIPAALRENFKIAPGDLLEVKPAQNGLLYKPKDLIDRNVAQYWRTRAQEPGEKRLSKRGRAKLNRALTQIEKGLSKEFDNVDELIKDLNQ